MVAANRGGDSERAVGAVIACPKSLPADSKVDQEAGFWGKAYRDQLTTPVPTTTGA